MQLRNRTAHHMRLDALKRQSRRQIEQALDVAAVVAAGVRGKTPLVLQIAPELGEDCQPRVVASRLRPAGGHVTGNARARRPPARPVASDTAYPSPEKNA